jgi:hypothetical protein
MFEKSPMGTNHDNRSLEGPNGMIQKNFRLDPKNNPRTVFKMTKGFWYPVDIYKTPTLE